MYKRRLRPQLTYSCLTCGTSLFGAPPTKDNNLVKNYKDTLLLTDLTVPAFPFKLILLVIMYRSVTVWKLNNYLYLKLSFVYSTLLYMKQYTTIRHLKYQTNMGNKRITNSHLRYQTCTIYRIKFYLSSYSTLYCN